MESLLPPIIYKSPIDNKKYAIHGNPRTWHIVDDSVTIDDLLKQWEPARPKAVHRKTMHKQWKVPNSKGNGEYTVIFDGAWSCDCVGFGFRRDCKHIRTIKK